MDRTQKDKADWRRGTAELVPNILITVRSIVERMDSLAALMPLNTL
jgi:hypothetical protein